MSEIQSVSHMHDQIMNWMLANPGRPLRECADYFEITQPWLSTVIHSDVFQAKFRERQEAVFGQVMLDIPTKLKGLADAAIEALAEQLATNTDKNYTLDAFDKIMHRAGYAPQKAATPNSAAAVVNNFVVDASFLAEARSSMRHVAEKTVEALPAETAEAPEAPPSEVQSIESSGDA